MAMQMAQAALQATASVAAAAAPMADVALPADCPMHHAADAATAAAPGGGPHAGHAGDCTLSDICHGASLASAPAALGAVTAPHAAPTAANTRFASVLRASDLRPPIL